MPSKVNIGHPKWPIDLKWPVMRSKVIFGHPKWPTAAILSKNLKKNYVAYRSEMARNVIESEIRTSKMADGSHFVKNFYKNSVSIWNGQICDRKWISDIQNGRSIWNVQKCDQKWISDIQNGRRQPFCQKFLQKLKFRIALKWLEMRSKVNFGHPKWAPVY